MEYFKSYRVQTNGAGQWASHLRPWLRISLRVRSCLLSVALNVQRASVLVVRYPFHHFLLGLLVRFSKTIFTLQNSTVIFFCQLWNTWDFRWTVTPNIQIEYIITYIHSYIRFTSTVWLRPRQEIDTSCSPWIFALFQVFHYSMKQIMDILLPQGCFAAREHRRTIWGGYRTDTPMPETIYKVYKIKAILTVITNAASNI